MTSSLTACATRLNKSFITPFDREDIYMMSSALDDIVDLIDDAARAIVIFDVRGNHALRAANGQRDSEDGR